MVRVRSDRTLSLESSLKTLADSNIIGVAIADEVRVLQANDLFLSLVGYSRAELESGKVRWLEATAPESRERERSAIQELRERGVCAPFEKTYMHADGSRVEVIKGAAVLTEEPTLTWIFFALDQTKQKALERELKEANSNLLASNAELRRFAFAVAHDFQSPLRTVRSIADELSASVERELDPECRRLAEDLRSNLLRLSGMLSDLLDYSTTLERRGTPLRAVDAQQLLSWALMNLRSEIEQTRAKIVTGRLPVVHADHQLVRVFQNILQNAMKYRKPEHAPEIHVSATREQGGWRFAVRDNGIGFDMAFADRIFLPLRRLHGPDQYSGTGMGLAICRNIVESYGGRIWAESEAGEASTFHFSIPDPGLRKDGSGRS